MSLAILALLLACGDKPDVSSNSTYESTNRTDQPKLDRERHQLDQAPPQAEESIAARLDKVIEKANATHKSLLSFVGTVFDDSLRQGGILACSSYRLLMLTGRQQLDRSEIPQFGDRISSLISSTGFISFTADSYAIWIKVPPSFSYERSLGEKSKRLEYSHYGWAFNSCEEEFKAPVPNGEGARNEERQRFAQMIVRARLRLEYYQRLLPEIEVKASRALSLKASLGAVKGDLSVDLNPEIAAVKVREYENFLNNAAEAMSQWRREAAVDTLVKADEIDKVITIASGAVGVP